MHSGQRFAASQRATKYDFRLLNNPPERTSTVRDHKYESIFTLFCVSEDGNRCGAAELRLLSL